MIQSRIVGHGRDIDVDSYFPRSLVFADVGTDKVELGMLPPSV